MNTNGTGDRETLVTTLRELWKSNNDVERFRLTFDERQISESFGGWTVPVASGNAVGSGYELNRALGSIQEQVEARIKTPVFIQLTLNQT